ncbi:hypothetical protein QR98_0073310 [Sarcoptes scabiei]|uniref:Uncharacterized protein n=1 Tax=Sarcoptes scabiei TaxID=52283 RepID=A0A132ACT6_SARSC|nr:hypothetical protein QR98_0073310 [Sarcoptes scabiei]
MVWLSKPKPPSCNIQQKQSTNKTRAKISTKTKQIQKRLSCDRVVMIVSAIGPKCAVSVLSKLRLFGVFRKLIVSTLSFSKEN